MYIFLSVLWDLILSANYGCECHEYLLNYAENITCNITEQSIQRQGTTWIGVLENNTGVIPLWHLAMSVHSTIVMHQSVKILVNQTLFSMKTFSVLIIAQEFSVVAVETTSH